MYREWLCVGEARGEEELKEAGGGERERLCVGQAGGEEFDLEEAVCF